MEWALPLRRLLELAQANQTALEELIRRPEHAERHAELHERIDGLLGDGNVLAFPAGAGGPFGSVSDEELAPVVIQVIRDILQVDV